MNLSRQIPTLWKGEGEGEGEGGGEEELRERGYTSISLLLHPSTSSSIVSNESSYCLPHTGCGREGGSEMCVCQYPCVCVYVTSSSGSWYLAR